MSRLFRLHLDDDSAELVEVWSSLDGDPLAVELLACWQAMDDEARKDLLRVARGLVHAP